MYLVYCIGNSWWFFWVCFCCKDFGLCCFGCLFFLVFLVIEWLDWVYCWIGLCWSLLVCYEDWDENWCCSGFVFGYMFVWRDWIILVLRD